MKEKKQIGEEKKEPSLTISAAAIKRIKREIEATGYEKKKRDA